MEAVLNREAKDMIDGITKYMADVSNINTIGGYQEFCDEYGAILFTIRDNEDDDSMIVIEVDGEVYNVNYEWFMNTMKKIKETIKAIDDMEA